MRKIMDNLEHDIANGGVEAQSLAANCYVTMARKAQRALKDGTDKLAEDYIDLCVRSGCEGLAYAAGN